MPTAPAQFLSPVRYPPSFLHSLNTSPMARNCSYEDEQPDYPSLQEETRTENCQLQCMLEWDKIPMIITSHEQAWHLEGWWFKFGRNEERKDEAEMWGRSGCIQLCSILKGLWNDPVWLQKETRNGNHGEASKVAIRKECQWNGPRAPNQNSQRLLVPLL